MEACIRALQALEARLAPPGPIVEPRIFSERVQSKDIYTLDVLICFAADVGHYTTNLAKAPFIAETPRLQMLVKSFDTIAKGALEAPFLDLSSMLQAIQRSLK